MGRRTHGAGGGVEQAKGTPKLSALPHVPAHAYHHPSAIRRICKHGLSAIIAKFDNLHKRSTCCCSLDASSASFPPLYSLDGAHRKSSQPCVNPDAIKLIELLDSFLSSRHDTSTPRLDCQARGNACRYPGGHEGRLRRDTFLG